MTNLDREEAHLAEVIQLRKELVASLKLVSIYAKLVHSNKVIIDAETKQIIRNLTKEIEL